MIITALAPTRVSCFGGSTDVAPYCDLYGGITLSFTINLWEKVTLYTDKDLWTISDHQFPQGADPQLVYEILKTFGVNGTKHCRVKTEFDGVIGAGLGSSAAMSVALIAALSLWKKKQMTVEDIAEMAWDIEVNRLGWYGGKQDQYASAFGGGNILRFKNRKVEREKMPIPWIESIFPYLLLFYLGGQRKSHEIQKQFGILTQEKKEALDGIKKIVIEALEDLTMNQLFSFFDRLDKAWELKKKSNVLVTSPEIDSVYTLMKENGAYGGKILGAGGCGYMVVAAPIDTQHRIIEAMEQRGYEHILFYPVDEGVIVREE